MSAREDVWDGRIACRQALPAPRPVASAARLGRRMQSRMAPVESTAR